MSALPEQSRLGRYRILRELGRGAMGVVYEAEDESLQRRVAVKTMLLSDDPEERADHEARFRQEAKAAGGLNHPNVVTIYDLGREGDFLYIAMELLQGTELRNLMLAGTLALPVAVDLISQVASGLSVAHRRGIIHRDIKPSNIMVLAGNRAKLMDFGVARMQMSEVKTKTGVMLGSPKYMSPEQVEGKPADYRSDIFSLGSVLYELVTGQPPFQGGDLGTLLFDIVRASPTPPSLRNPAIPQLLDRTIAKAMSKDPAARYQDAAELADDLGHCIAAMGGLPANTPRVALSAAAPPPAAEEATRRMPTAAPPAGEYEKTQAAPVLPRHGAASAPVPAAPVAQAAVSGAGESGPAPQPAAAVPQQGLRVSLHFESAAALERLAQLGAARSDPGKAGASLRGRWVWPVAYGLAVLAAVWIASS